MSLFEELSAERKAEQEAGRLPKWMTTLGWQMLKDKYLAEGETYEERVRAVCATASKHLPDEEGYYEGRWVELLLRNHAYLSTPCLGNTGTTNGHPVSCSGGTVGDSVYDFGASRLQCSILSQEGYGTSSYLGDIRERGAEVSRGGTADGVVPVFDDFVSMARNISQGSMRRGAWAGYVDIEGGDFHEMCTYIKNNPGDANLGWVVRDTFVDLLEAGDEDAIDRFQTALQLKMMTGKGYFYFVDKVLRAQPECYADHNLQSKASNLCTEITLHSDEDHDFSCVLSGMVAETYDEWKDTDAVFAMTVFLDCLVSEMLQLASQVKGMEKIVRGTLNGRPLGLGLTGLHSLFQKRGLVFGGFEAHMLNLEIFKGIHDKSLAASEWLAEKLGEPRWCKGTGLRNTHRTALAPNTSSSLIFGSGSQGITPWIGNVYNESSASGGLFRVNPQFIELLKRYDQYTEEVLDDVLNSQGSCQHLDFLTPEEKAVFLTAFELNQKDIVRLAAARQQFICQSQSLNLFFAEEAEEELIAAVHKEAFLNENIKSLYYIRSLSGVKASDGKCVACES